MGQIPDNITGGGARVNQNGFSAPHHFRGPAADGFFSLPVLLILIPVATLAGNRLQGNRPAVGPFQQAFGFQSIQVPADGHLRNIKTAAEFIHPHRTC